MTQRPALTVFLLIFGLLFPFNAIAREVRFDKQIDPGTLQQQLKAAGFQVQWIECSTIHCKIVLPDSEKKDPMPFVKKYEYVSPEQIRAKQRARMITLVDRLDGKTITQEERDELLRMLVKDVSGY